MFKIDQVKNLYDCDQCNQLMVDPVTIACGYSICKRHLDEQLKDNSNERHSIRCELCHKKHSVPEEGFVVNKHIQNALDIKLNTLKLNPVYDECKKVIEEVRFKVITMETMEKDPENYTYEFFEEIKRQVYLRREDLKMRIDNCCEDIIQSINKTQADCNKISKKSNYIIKEYRDVVENANIELTELVNQFNTFDIDEKKFSDIKQSLALLNEKCTEKLAAHKEMLLKNRTCSFEFNEVQIENVFGHYNENIQFDSSILNSNLQSQLENLCEFPGDTKWELKYRATRDGFKSDNFHLKCNGISNTLTVIKTLCGNVFGAFTTRPWNSNNRTYTNQNAFIYSLVNNDRKPFKAMATNEGKNAIGCYAVSGPSFGSDGTHIKDIYVASDSNINLNSYSDFGYTYKHPDYPVISAKAKTILAGSTYFQTVEVEVFTKEFITYQFV